MKHDTKLAVGTDVPAAVLQEFLDALDRNDGDTLQRLGKALLNCTEIMPDDACINIGVVPGSTFALGARVLLSE